MSGILGKLSFDRDEILARPMLEQMLGTLQGGHLGATAIHTGPGIGLGWCGAAPLRDGQVATTTFRTVLAVADSALANAESLRGELERRGWRFRTGTDAEVVACAYDAWGERCVERFDGPFACAIWDERRERLLLARDHLGIRPLYFALLHGRGLVFASAPAALLQDPGVGRECCPEAIDAYLTLGYVPAPLTAFRRVSKLEPAHRLIVEGRRLHVEQYWDLPAASSGGGSGTAEALDGLLHEAIGPDRHTGATVLYSGGMASSALLAVAPADTHDALVIHLGDESHDGQDARDRARHLGHEPTLGRTAPDATLHATLDLSGRLDEPIADPAAIVQHVLCGIAGPGARTLCSGHGAAALWGGYARHRADRVQAIVRSWLAGRLGPVDHLAAPLRASLPHDARGGTAPVPASELWDDGRRSALYTRTFASQVRDVNPFARHVELYASRETDDPVDRARYVDVRTFLPDSVLTVAARAAADTGLAFVFPYLQRDLVELAAATPPAVLGSEGGMLPLRTLLAHRLPPALLPPPRRAGAHAWLHRVLASLVPAVLITDRFDGRGIVSRTGLRQVWDEHCSGRDHSRRLWSLLMLELWFRHVLDGNAAEEPLTDSLMLRAA